MHVIEMDLSNRTQVKQFLKLPFRLYAKIPQWVPPLEPDAKRILDPAHNPFFKHGQAGFFLA